MDFTIDVKNIEQINQYFTLGYIPIITMDGQKYKNFFDKNKRDENHFYIKEDLIIKQLQLQFGKELTNSARYKLLFISKNASAKNIHYKMIITLFLGVFLSCFHFSNILFYFVNNIIFATQNLFKMYLFYFSYEDKSENYDLDSINYDSLPIYTILIPLFHEENKVNQILRSINDLNYPRNKIDVKFLLEKDDKLTRKAIRLLDIPDYVQIISIPHSSPKTKPKALNYSLPFVKGVFLTIYDAEDIPDKDQLLKAVINFKNLSDNYACIQSKLNFYNKNHNLLTRLFSIEYSFWFDYLLKSLSKFNLPVPLGGTSNHFKVSILKKVGFWDAYNVTEDADLGLRLYKEGYKVYLMNSTTLEESPTTISVWLGQRSRWIKGFIQTYIVFLKNYNKQSRKGYYAVHIFMGMSSYTFFCTPWLMILPFKKKIFLIMYYCWIANGVIYMLFMQTVSCFILSKSNKLTGKDFLTVLLWPIYFFLHSIACYIALGELIINPFKWNKTPHG